MTKTKEALKSLMDSQEVVSRGQLERMMEEELSKEAAEIDTDYVDELARLILECGDGQSVSGNAGKPAGRRVHRQMMKIAAAAAVLTLILGGMNVAGAWSWIEIVEFFTPLMEQLGIQVNVQPEETINEIRKNDEVHAAGETWDELRDGVITDLTGLPTAVDGYPVVPPVLPEGFEFVRANVFSDASMKTVLMTFERDGVELYAELMLYAEEIGNAVWFSEQIPETMRLHDIHIYEDCEVWTAYLKLERGYYNIWGKLEEGEIRMIAEEYIGVIDE